MRASEKAYESLRHDIVQWCLAPGTVLAEVEQSARLGVSRTPVREALARLVADGLAVQQRGRGVVVSEVSLEHLDDLFDLRRALECEAARLACRSPRRAEFADLATAFTAAAHTEQIDSATEDYYQLVARLDELIDQAADNAYLATALRNLRVHLQRVRRLAKDHPARLRASANEHAQIAHAIASGNTDLARAATTMHLHQSFQHITHFATDLKGTND
ncbi:GntR family transcriptional regulator [Glutamicibacter sp. MNS18]|uniref:GntR family transcriptional regulator n=1 Tax=Glutamicibacter sp. MNS18 TaxID=2989817 RepID=UPI002236268C|nr:GntR family transcriptional regulator [Glutamicibacter sp. MNS18]MCW4466957.1 GntR family transcriptional regulator [Glutamicibacter sp. MNS18]